MRLPELPGEEREPVAAKLTKKQQAALDAEYARIAALPDAKAGDSYCMTIHPTELLERCNLGVSYADPDCPVLVEMGVLDDD